MNKISSILLTLSLTAFFVGTTLPAGAVTVNYNPNNLVSDKEFQTNTLTSSRLNSWFKDMGSVLADYKTVDRTGTLLKVSKIMVDTAERYNLNAKLFAVLAQKESGAITSSTMNDHILNRLLGFGVCDSCTPQDYAQYEGIARQIDTAAAQFRDGYLADLESRGYTISGWQVGKTKTTLDGLNITPENNATAALYTYNPWGGAYFEGGSQEWGGNSLFQKLWQEYEGLNGPSLSQIIRLPDGTLAQTRTGAVYLIKGGKKRAFLNKGALVANFDPSKIVPVDDEVISTYRDGVAITFPQYSLLRIESGTVFLLVGNKLRGFTSSQALRNTGINPIEIIDVKWEEIAHYKPGEPITEETLYPSTALIQTENGAVFYVNRRGNKQPIVHRDILENNFPDTRHIEQVTESEVQGIKETYPLAIKEGTLVSSPKTDNVYVIENGQKRRFDSPKTFETYGYRWENVEVVSHKVLKLHKKGKPVTLKEKKKKKK